MQLMFVALLVAPFFVHCLAWWLNLRTLARELPPESLGAYAPEQYRKSQAYTRAQTKLAAASAIVGLLATLAFWFAGGFGALDRLVLSWQLPPLVAGLAYLGLLLFARRLFLLTPFVVYQDFVIEQRFGFNRYTPATFALDFLKWRMINGVIYGLAATFTLALFAWGGASAWWYVWIAVAALTVAVTFVAPQWILPLFYRFTSLPEGELRQRIAAQAAQLGYPLAGVFLIDSSRQTSKSEAICLGFGRNRRVALSDTLLSRHPTDELATIVAHEVGHARYHHTLKRLAAHLALYGVLCFLLSLLLQSDSVFAAVGVPERSSYVGLVLFMLLYGAWQEISTVPIKCFCRCQEFQADAFAACAVGDPEVVVRMLSTMAADNLIARHEHPLYTALHRAHPTVAQRLAALHKIIPPA